MEDKDGLISIDFLLKRLNEVFKYPDNTFLTVRQIIEILNKTKKVDASPIIHAHVISNWLGDCRCSNCGDSEINCTKNYCHNCGARFDEPEEHEY